jgi:deoxyribodipyrimidine photo-lyase
MSRLPLPQSINSETTLFWFRRDLRLADNAGLYQALKNNKDVAVVFIFDTTILTQLEDKHDPRVEFIYQSIKILKEELERIGSSIMVWIGNPVELFKTIKVKAVYCNHDYDPNAIARDNQVKDMVEANRGAFHSYKDHVVFEKNEVVKDDGDHYTVFTPYSKKWKAKLKSSPVKAYPSEKYLGNLQSVDPFYFPSLAEIGFKETGRHFPECKISTKIIEDYHRTRDFPAQAGTTRLSVHLRFGTVSIRKLALLATQKNETWLNELIWRDFYHMILWHAPQVEVKCFKPNYENIPWRNKEDEFRLWCEGKTGYPLVDAGMRELNATGFMHNRARMVTASFLTKHLLIDWRWGEAYFAKKLMDYDLAANNGGWQWAAGCGCDAVPYFRVFNPLLQAKKFDPDELYIHKWVPEIGTADYRTPIVNHQFGRGRLLLAYKKALQTT